jgi:hypothetical protein
VGVELVAEDVRGMSEVLTAALTVFAGFVVFVGGQIVQRFLLEPIQEQRRVIGEIAYVLLYHGNVGRFVPFESQQSRDDTAATLRRLAAELRTTRATIPAYRQLEKTPWVVKTENVITASSSLVGWSNSVIGGTEDTLSQHKDAVRESLGILR